MSVKRLREFLKSEELDAESIDKTDEPPAGEIFDTRKPYTYVNCNPTKQLLRSIPTSFLTCRWG